MRVRKKKWSQGEIDSNILVVQTPEAFKGNWRIFFENDKPIHIELGCGKGGFAYETATKNQDINFIGIEKKTDILAAACKGIRLDLSGKKICAPDNLIFIRADAENLQDFFSEGEVSRIYINFCDPWHKKRKRLVKRLTYRSFLDLYKKIMSTGEIHLKTDNKDLFDFSIKECKDTGWILKNVSYDLHNSGYIGNIMTEYEKYFAELGNPIYRLEAAVDGASDNLSGR